MGPENALRDLAIIFAVLFLAAAVARRLSQSVVPFYIAAGVALQPLIREPEIVQVFALLGVGVLLFVIGLEFSLAFLTRNAGPLIRAGLWDLGINYGLGLAAGLAIGLPWLAACFFAGAFYITSSVIVAKSIMDEGLAANAETPAALGILVFEDLSIALFLAVMAGVAAAGSVTLAPIASGIARSVAFAGGLLLLAHVGRRPLGRWLRRADDEHLVIFLFFWLIAAAAAAHALELSEAVGAFLAGLVVAETDEKPRVERILVPYQQLFAALFFVAFGLMIDLGELRSVWALGLGLALLGLVGKVLAGWVIGWRQGMRAATRLRLGFLLAPRGEFSIVVVGAAVALAVPAAERLPALVAIYVLALSLVGPLLVSHGDPLIRVLTRVTFDSRTAGS